MRNPPPSFRGLPALGLLGPPLAESYVVGTVLVDRSHAAQPQDGYRNTGRISRLHNLHLSRDVSHSRSALSIIATQGCTHAPPPPLPDSAPLLNSAVRKQLTNSCMESESFVLCIMTNFSFALSKAVQTRAPLSPSGQNNRKTSMKSGGRLTS